MMHSEVGHEDILSLTFVLQLSRLMAGLVGELSGTRLRREQATRDWGFVERGYPAMACVEWCMYKSARSRVAVTDKRLHMVKTRLSKLFVMEQGGCV
jgi:hypothetical protein